MNLGNILERITAEIKKNGPLKEGDEVVSLLTNGCVLIAKRDRTLSCTVILDTPVRLDLHIAEAGRDQAIAAAIRAVEQDGPLEDGDEAVCAFPDGVCVLSLEGETLLSRLIPGAPLEISMAIAA